MHPKVQGDRKALVALRRGRNSCVVDSSKPLLLYEAGANSLPFSERRYHGCRRCSGTLASRIAGPQQHAPLSVNVDP